MISTLPTSFKILDEKKILIGSELVEINNLT